MSRGDVICRGCGTCLRERVAVDDSDMRLDDATGEESTVKKSAVKRPAVGLDDRYYI
jgi:transcription initiation factor TFIIIB Brf1 subunit/transcription initiation factor TFIIB